MAKKHHGPSSSTKKSKLTQSLAHVQQAQLLREKQRRALEAQEQQGKKKSPVMTVSRRKEIMPFVQNESVLLIGEANFSFAHSLLQLDAVSPTRLVATSYDSESECLEKYPDAKSHVNALRDKGAHVLFNVDATRLTSSKEIKSFAPFHKIVFNFPHVGLGIKDKVHNIRANQRMLLLFFRSAAQLLAQGPSNTDAPKKRANDSDNSDTEDYLPSVTRGMVLVSLRTHPPYSEWLLPQLAKKGDLMAASLLEPALARTAQPLYTLVTSFRFVPSLYPGYEHARTLGYRETDAANAGLLQTSKGRRSGDPHSSYDDALRMYEFELL